MMMERIAAFRAAVGAWQAKEDAIARANDAIGAGADMATVDRMERSASCAIQRSQQALDALYAAFGVKPTTYGGQRHTDARLRIWMAVDRIAGIAS
jgi:hypothetical protein